MDKYNLIPEQLLYEGTIESDNLFEPDVLTEEQVLLTHDPEYWEKLKHQTLTPREIRKTGFPLSERLVHREINIGKGTWMCTKFARQFGVSMNISGGTHHAFTNRGEGFCLLNDIAMAANLHLQEYPDHSILVVDLDVHQGNGTAEIFQQESRVFTFSMHCRANYPLQKEKSDLDLELPPYIEDAEYLRHLYETLPRLIDQVQPDLAFFLSGVDIIETDKLGHLNVSRNGCKERDRFVFEQMKRNQIPLVVSMGGGYSPRISDIVEAHCNTYRSAQEIYF